MGLPAECCLFYWADVDHCRIPREKNLYADEVIFYYNSLSSGQSITLLKASILARQIFEKWPELCEICFDKQYLVKLKWSITNSICLR